MYQDHCAGVSTMSLMYLLLYRSQAISRVLAGMLQWTAVARELFGLDVAHALLVPLGVVYPLTGLWLLARGLAAAPVSAATCGPA